MDYQLPDGQAIKMQVKTSRGRRLKVSYHIGEPYLRLRIPGGVTQHEVNRFLTAHPGELQSFGQELQQYLQRREAYLNRIDQGQLPLFGDWHPLQTYAHRGLRLTEPFSGAPRLGHPPEMPLHQAAGMLLPLLAKKELPRRLRLLAEETGTPFKRVFVKHLTSKWGSCSSRANVNLNWHLILLPEPIVRYLLVHELMHLREMNHSARFWAWVERFEPDYRRLNAQIDEWQWLIGIFEPLPV